MSSDAQVATLSDGDARPIVRTAATGSRSLWLFAGALVIAAALLFEALNARREQLNVPATQGVPANGAAITAPPPLALPPQFQAPLQAVYPNLAAAPLQPVLPPAPRPMPRAPTRLPPMITNPVPQYVPPPAVIGSGPPAQTDLTMAAQGQKAPALNERVLASRLSNPSLTVPQGTVIAAVLETALDSTRAGGARAIVQRDVMGFDGTRVLIPRGSRLFGEYQSDVSSGQKRALIRWTRLTRPDAVIMNLDSPSVDPLGRAGIEGKVNSHFFARFSGAILQSMLNLGVGVATSAALDKGAFIALPATQALPTVQKEIQPTLRVRQGTSVSVLVARDLDFSSVEQ